MTKRKKDQNKVVKYALLRGRLVPREQVIEKELTEKKKPGPKPKVTAESQTVAKLPGSEDFEIKEQK